MSTDTTLATHRFTLTLKAVSELTDELQGKLLEAGCDDASLWSEGETVFLDFSREAVSLPDALKSAAEDVARAGLTIARIDFDDHVTSLAM